MLWLTFQLFESDVIVKSQTKRIKKKTLWNKKISLMFLNCNLTNDFFYNIKLIRYKKIPISK